jgi:ATP-dependent RNA helicase RhlE
LEFKDLHIIPAILKALENEQYDTPTPIQEQAIPPALEGRDLLGCAQTGTGKTAAFAIPTLQRLSAKANAGAMPAAPRSIRSLVLTPTRELAVQVYESFCAYGRHTGLRACVVFGGVAQSPQEEALRRGTDILVATPGRLLDLMNQGLVDLRHVEILTLDEADRMLDMGFIHDVRKIIAKVPEKRQTFFFSATIPQEIAALSRSLLINPVRVSITPETPTVDAIEQSVYFVDKQNKRLLLLHLLKDPAIVSALVFTRTKHGADRVTKELLRGNVRAQAIHGDKSQGARQQALNGFKQGLIRVLVATDIAARGLDIDDLSLVVNFDLPNIPETYIHRIGRTGRAGKGGIAISLCDFDEKPLLADIEKLCGRHIPIVEDHPYPMLIHESLPKPQAMPGKKPQSGNPGLRRPRISEK